MSDLNLYSVNWQDGMLITQRHLMDLSTQVLVMVSYPNRLPENQRLILI